VGGGGGASEKHDNKKYQLMKMRETGAGETSEWDRVGPVAAANLLAGH
jgi:hypothetical protein